MKLHLALRHIYQLHEREDSLKDLSVVSNYLESLCNETTQEALDVKKFFWYMQDTNVFAIVLESESLTKGFLDAIRSFQQHGLSKEKYLWVITHCVYALGKNVILPINENQRISFEGDQLTYLYNDTLLSSSDVTNPMESLLEENTIVIFFELAGFEKSIPLYYSYYMRKNIFIVRFMNGFWWYIPHWKVHGWQWVLGVISWMALVLASVLIPIYILHPLVSTQVLILSACIIFLGDISYILLHKLMKKEKQPLLIWISVLVQSTLILLLLLPIQLYYVVVAIDLVLISMTVMTQYVIGLVELKRLNPYVTYFLACWASQVIVGLLVGAILQSFVAYFLISTLISTFCAVGLYLIRNGEYNRKLYPKWDKLYSIGLVFLIVRALDTPLRYFFKFSADYAESEHVMGIAAGIWFYLFIYSLVNAIVSLFSMKEGTRQVFITIGVVGILLPGGMLFWLIRYWDVSYDVFVVTYLLHIFFHAVVLFKRNYDVSALIHVVYGVIIIAIRLFLIGT